MSILPPIARMLLAEHKRRPIIGRLLTIGRQSVPMSHGEAAGLMAEMGVDPRPGFIDEIDTGTVGAGENHLNDRAFFSLFCAAHVRSLDVSAYEGAGIVHDLNDELPQRLRGIADFIFDGSCLDNIFDPARALRSMSRMLSPGGRMFCFNHATPIQSAYLCFTPEWFWDFFTANGYWTRVYTASFATILDDWDVQPWSSGAGRPERDYMVVAIAEKNSFTTDDRTPIQEHYRRMHDKNADQLLRSVEESGQL